MGEIPHGFCHCGCGQRTSIIPKTYRARGLVKGEPMRYRKGHHFRRPGPPYTVDEQTGCWIWTGIIDKDGYGQAYYGRQVRAHRYFYEQRHGPIPDGLQIDHLCRNRACVNPDHLEPVTPADNTRRGRGAKLTVEQVREIKRLLGSVKQRDLARRFAIDEAGISDIANGKRWVDVEAA
jgi:hypothetical protein